ncbi:hypothetical protein [Allonocardiopsis opalescens]|uniref:hypothetical protein n=1 Tax=Allonocardiopsis opalescens TaxID=1144618 RepID=UPI0011B23357|nr:hypothetical protein [Allonocardiopsis opalescens]
MSRLPVRKIRPDIRAYPADWQELATEAALVFDFVPHLEEPIMIVDPIPGLCVAQLRRGERLGPILRHFDLLAEWKQALYTMEWGCPAGATVEFALDMFGRDYRAEPDAAPPWIQQWSGCIDLRKLTRARLN